MKRDRYTAEQKKRGLSGKQIRNRAGMAAAVLFAAVMAGGCAALIREGERHYPEGDRIYQEEDAKPWGAIEAYRIHDSRYGFRNQYLICWENVLAEIYFPWEPDEGQKGIVGKNLNKLALTS